MLHPLPKSGSALAQTSSPGCGHQAEGEGRIIPLRAAHIERGSCQEWALSEAAGSRALERGLEIGDKGRGEVRREENEAWGGG